MLMTNGIGASLGTFIAGKYIFTPRIEAPGETAQQILAGFHESWLIMAAYALVVFIAFVFIFKDDHKVKNAKGEAMLQAKEHADAGGMADA